MADYIKREALREILDGWRDAHADVDDVHGCGLLEDVICEVDAQTAADVAPVVHGWWIKRRNGGTLCSRCGHYTQYKGQVLDMSEAIACPWCGAKMDGERKDGGDG